MADTLAGARFFISTTAENSDLTQTEFEALTFIEVSNVGDVGETGTSTNILTFDEWGTGVSQKSKGTSNAGDPEIQVAVNVNNAGQDAMRAACEVVDNFAFKILLKKGIIRYNRGIVAGPKTPHGKNEDFVLEVYTLGLNQKQITDKGI